MFLIPVVLGSDDGYLGRYRWSAQPCHRHRSQDQYQCRCVWTMTFGKS